MITKGIIMQAVRKVNPAIEVHTWMVDVSYSDPDCFDFGNCPETSEFDFWAFVPSGFNEGGKVVEINGQRYRVDVKVTEEMQMGRRRLVVIEGILKELRK